MKKRKCSILIAPNAFKHSLSATQVAKAIGKGIQMSKLEASLHYFPIGDGGDGTIDLIIDHLGAKRKSKEVTGPLGKPIQAEYGIAADGKTAFIELANASGIKLIEPEDRDPLRANTYGTGELMLNALDEGVEQLIIGMGGSATVDGGCGILAALGARFYDQSGNVLSAYPEQLMHVAKVDFDGLDARLHRITIVILCDVVNQLLGDSGAAAIFGPQKGASSEDVQQLDRFLNQFSKALKRVTGKDMSHVISGGAAGGAAGGLYAALNARLEHGIDYFMKLTGFEQALMDTDVLITGEGSLDSQTLEGKGPYGVARKAKEKEIPVIGIAGKVPLVSNAAIDEVFDVLLAIGNEPMSLVQALEVSRENLIRIGKAIGNLLHRKPS
ncbi:glycerate 3-kinase [Olivibacter ginsenosidimutans]|uniref:Glycerate 3-kinase n=1 Tax=Olivibacter ginsenosidimutans TaxID=1176537 RepID=A0ABP9B983_9SPHI